MSVVLRTVGAAHNALQLDPGYANARGGAEFTGLGCSLEEWDAIAETMRPGTQPSERGAWSAAFERAAVRFRQTQPRPRPHRENTFEARAREIAHALGGGPLALTEIATIVDRHAPSVREDLLALIAAEFLTVTEAVVRQTRVKRYALSTRAARAFAAERTAAAERGDA